MSMKGGENKEVKIRMKWIWSIKRRRTCVKQRIDVQNYGRMTKKPQKWTCVKKTNCGIEIISLGLSFLSYIVDFQILI